METTIDIAQIERRILIKRQLIEIQEREIADMEAELAERRQDSNPAAR